MLLLATALLVAALLAEEARIVRRYPLPATRHQEPIGPMTPTFRD